MKTTRCFPSLILSLAVLTAGAFAADPTGRIPVSPDTTPGDADSVYRIATPGSYYLSADVLGAAGKSGIEIAASHVTLDLNGFTLRGQVAATDGIRVVAATDPEGITIRNGSIEGWGGCGINLFANQSGWKGESAVIEYVTATRNLSVGIKAAMYASIRHCTASHNVGAGIQAIVAVTVDSSVAIGNGASGIDIGGGSARGCLAAENTRDGFRGLSGAIMTDCTSSENEAAGFDLQNGSAVENCTANSNGSFGFQVSSGRVEGCSAWGNTEGGIKAVYSCSVIGNTINGYVPVGDSSVIRWGILVTGRSNEVVGNAVSYSSTGIRLVNSSASSYGGNYIAQNRLLHNRVGVAVETGNNVIVGNSARSYQVNYRIAVANRVGTIVGGGNTSTPINGNSGGSVGTTDPWSNLAF